MIGTCLGVRSTSARPVDPMHLSDLWETYSTPAAADTAHQTFGTAALDTGSGGEDGSGMGEGWPRAYETTL